MIYREVSIYQYQYATVGHPGVEELGPDTDTLDIKAEIYIRVDCLGRTGISSELLGWDVLDEFPQIFFG